MVRIQEAMTAAFDDMDGVLEEVAAMAAEALESNRAESSRLKGEMGEADKMLAGLTRLLVDPDIEPLAKKSVARQIGEWEGKRDGLRQALEGVAVQAVDDMDELMADCRRAFLEAKADFAGLMTPAQVNGFVAEVVGPLEVLPDGSVRQKETVDSEALSTVAIAGARYARRPQGPGARRDLVAMSIRAVFWAHFSRAA